METAKHKCCETVFHSNGNGWGSHIPCKNTAKHNENGGWYCGTHAPSIVAAKRNARTEKWKAEWEAESVAKAKAKAEAAETARRAALFDELVAMVRRFDEFSNLPDWSGSLALVQLLEDNRDLIRRAKATPESHQ